MELFKLTHEPKLSQYLWIEYILLQSRVTMKFGARDLYLEGFRSTGPIRRFAPLIQSHVFRLQR